MRHVTELARGARNPPDRPGADWTYVASQAWPRQWGRIPIFKGFPPRNSRGGKPWVPARVELVEAGRELLDDPVAEHVRHVEDVPVHLVVGDDVGVPVPLEPRDGLLCRELEVHAHLCLHRGERPVARVNAV